MRTALVVLTFGVSAFAQEGATRSIGAGSETLVLGELDPAAAVTAMFDLRHAYVEALVSAFYREDKDTSFVGGGRFYYIVDRGSSADFAVGAGLGIVWVDPDVGDSDVGVWFGVGAKLRAFVVPSVALTAGLGIDTVFIDDATGFDLRADPVGSMGAIYFF